MRKRMKHTFKAGVLLGLMAAMPLNQGCEAQVIGQIMQAVLPALMQLYSAEAQGDNISNEQRATAWGSALSSMLGGVGGVLSRIPTSRPGATGATGASGASGRTGPTGGRADTGSAISGVDTSAPGSTQPIPGASGSSGALPAP